MQGTAMQVSEPEGSERLGTILIYAVALFWYIGQKARWSWALFVLFIALGPLVYDEHPWIGVALIAGGIGCIILQVLPNRDIPLPFWRGHRAGLVARPADRRRPRSIPRSRTGKRAG